jgi:hypothetical protein
VEILKLTIRKTQECKIKIVATICDQGSANQAAINCLLRESTINSKRKLIINNEDIVQTLYDPPHLIKGIRNNFLYKNLIWNNDEGTCTAKWKDIENASMMDRWSGEFSAMPTLTDQHVVPAKINKMKVAFCTQVFSHTVAAAMRLMAKKRK